MTRFLLDTGIAGLYLSRRHGIFERAQTEVFRGNPIGIAGPVLAELAFVGEGSPHRERNLRTIIQALKTLRLWLPTPQSCLEWATCV